MSVIIDRRLNPRDRAIKNRQKFIQRSREQIKKYQTEPIIWMFYRMQALRGSV